MRVDNRESAIFLFIACCLLTTCLLLSCVSVAAQFESITKLDTKKDYLTYLSQHDSLYQDKTFNDIANEHTDMLYPKDVAISGISYRADGHLIRGFLFQPLTPGPHPAIIYNRGGNRDFGSITHGISSIGPEELSAIASWGYVVIASQYRGGGGSEGRDEFGGKDINDVLALEPLLKNMENVDEQRLGMFGWSRGSMMSFIALKKGLKVKALIVGGVVGDLIATNEHRPGFDQMFDEMDPNYEKNKELWLKERSAMFWTEDIPLDIPILLLSGSSDWRTEASQAINLVHKLDAQGHPLRYVMFEGGNHSLSTHKEEVFMQLRNWLDRFVRDLEPVPKIDTTPKS